MIDMMSALFAFLFFFFFYECQHYSRSSKSAYTGGQMLSIFRRLSCACMADLRHCCISSLFLSLILAILDQVGGIVGLSADPGEFVFLCRC